MCETEDVWGVMGSSAVVFIWAEWSEYWGNYPVTLMATWMWSAELKTGQLGALLLLLPSKAVIPKFTSTLESPGTSWISCCLGHIQDQLNLNFIGGGHWAFGLGLSSPDDLNMDSSWRTIKVCLTWNIEININPSWFALFHLVEEFKELLPDFNHIFQPFDLSADPRLRSWTIPFARLHWSSLTLS